MKKIFPLMLLCATILFTSCSNDDESVAVTGVNLDKTTLSITAGGTAALNAALVPENATVKDVSWTSDNTSVATVNEKGEITAVSAGKAVISVTTADGNLTAACTVTVTPLTIAVTGVTINKATLELKTGGKETLSSTVAPQNATNLKVSWSSSKPDIASVDAASGEVTANAEGKATITVKTEDGEKTATCEVTVSIFVSTEYTSETIAGVEPTGNGTEENPYLIEYAENLKWMKIQNGEDGTATKGKYYKLMNDINVTSDTWVAIKKYNGAFDGNNHKITGKLNAPDDLKENFGFIGLSSSATFKNLRMEADIYAPLTENVGAISGFYFAKGDFPNIVNCVNSGKVTGKKRVGGLIGHLVGGYEGTKKEHTIVSDCTNKGDVVTLDNAVGGVIGYVFLNTPDTEAQRHKYCIQNCKNEGNVTGTTETEYGSKMGVAGVAGYVLANSNTFLAKGCGNASNAIIKLGDIIATKEILIGNKNSKYVGWIIGRDSNVGSVEVE